MSVVDRSLRAVFDPGSGPAVARLFQRLLALVFLDAWISLALQIRLLIGEHGLLPIDDFAAHLRESGALSLHDLHQFPSLFVLGGTDTALVTGCLLGIGLALAWLLGFAPRVCAATSLVLYLWYAVACRTFCSFQWDNLILECALLATFLPTERRARWIHVLFRLLLLKLYVESGLAKLQSPIHDWTDGSAMTFYYETAPLPTRLAYYFHFAPVWYHHLESWATLRLELYVPFLAFGPRIARRVAFVLLTGFQIANLATANYGFFVYNTLALHVFLLDDADLDRVRGWVARLVRREPEPPREERPSSGIAELALALVVMTAWCFISVVEGAMTFANVDPEGEFAQEVEPLREAWAPFRLVDTYHLFAAITRERVEPTVETSEDGKTWVEQDLHHKPGPVDRAPDWVAPHQPRVDFQLWFYGLSYRRGAPEYVANLVDRLCSDPEAVQPLFVQPLPSHPRAVRLSFWQYHFNPPSERRQSGHWWRRELLGSTHAKSCS